MRTNGNMEESNKY